MEGDIPFLINSTKKTIDCIKVSTYVTQGVLPLKKPFFLGLRFDRVSSATRVFVLSGSYLNWSLAYGPEGEFWVFVFKGMSSEKGFGS